MIKRITQLATRMLIVLTLLAFSFSAGASHITGGDISFQCVGQDSFVVTLNLFRDCSGLTGPTSAALTFMSSCDSFYQTLPNINPGGTEVSPLCPAQLLNSTCNGGWLPGMQLFIYEAIVVFPTPCADWNISYNICCHNTTANLVGQPWYWIDATMDNVVNACNNSPRFTSLPVPYVCVNQPVTFNFGVIEPDGDSLFFSPFCVRSAQPSCVNYINPYTFDFPIQNGFSLDPNTGQISFTPNTIGSFAVVVQCEEFDPITQNLLSVTMRETQVIVINCSNTAPSDTSGYIQNFYSTNGTLTGPYSMQLCIGDSISFDMCSYDIDVGDSVSLSSNITSIFPGATFISIPGNPACATVSWIVQPNQPTNNMFTITANDSACPVMGTYTYLYNVEITGTYAGPDLTLCQGDSVQLQVTGIFPYTWTVISGDPINVGVNFSCTNCGNPMISPDSTTTYEVESSTVGGCIKIDTITVFVIQPEVGSINGAITVTELSSEIYSVIQTAGYSYNWTITGGLITTGQGTNSIDISWASPGQGTVCVNKTNTTWGCVDSVCVMIDIATIGVDESNVDDNIFIIHPNPSSGQFTVSNGQLAQTIKVYDLFGRIVLTTTLPQIDMRGYAKGVYFIRVGEVVRKLVLH